MACGRKIGPYDCCSVVQGDCLELMREIPDGAVDAVITDPPYGIAWGRATWADDPAAYGGLMRHLSSEAERLSSPSSPIFIWQSATNISLFHEWFPAGWRIFIAARNFVQMRPTAMNWAYDPVVVWWKEGPKPFTAGECTRDWFISDNASRISNPNNPEKAHPCPKPVDGFIFVLSQWVKPGAVVFDPFTGSGTTLVAAKKLGRHFLGFEISEEYCQIARDRIARIEAQPNLFEPTPEQLKLNDVPTFDQKLPVDLG